VTSKKVTGTEQKVTVVVSPQATRWRHDTHIQGGGLLFVLLLFAIEVLFVVLVALLSLGIFALFFGVGRFLFDGYDGVLELLRQYDDALDQLEHQGRQHLDVFLRVEPVRAETALAARQPRYRREDVVQQQAPVHFVLREDL